MYLGFMKLSSCPLGRSGVRAEMSSGLQFWTLTCLLLLFGCCHTARGEVSATSPQSSGESFSVTSSNSNEDRDSVSPTNGSGKKAFVTLIKSSGERSSVTSSNSNGGTVSVSSTSGSGKSTFATSTKGSGDKSSVTSTSRAVGRKSLRLWRSRLETEQKSKEHEEVLRFQDLLKQSRALLEKVDLLSAVEQENQLLSAAEEAKGEDVKDDNVEKDVQKQQQPITGSQEMDNKAVIKDSQLVNLLVLFKQFKDKLQEPQTLLTRMRRKDVTSLDFLTSQHFALHYYKATMILGLFICPIVMLALTVDAAVTAKTSRRRKVSDIDIEQQKLHASLALAKQPKTTYKPMVFRVISEVGEKQDTPKPPTSTPPPATKPKYASGRQTAKSKGKPSGHERLLPFEFHKKTKAPEKIVSFRAIPGVTLSDSFELLPNTPIPASKQAFTAEQQTKLQGLQGETSEIIQKKPERKVAKHPGPHSTTKLTVPVSLIRDGDNYWDSNGRAWCIVHPPKSFQGEVRELIFHLIQEPMHATPSTTQGKVGAKEEKEDPNSQILPFRIPVASAQSDED